MRNIHIYPSPLTNESRMLREAGSLAKMGLFERIDLVGIRVGDLAKEESAGDKVFLRRLGPQRGRGGIVRKIAATLTWSLSVFREYWNKPVSCINCHSVAMLPLSVALKWATRARLVYDAHELETEANGLGSLRRAIARTIEKTLIGRADHCIFVGQEIQDWYVKRYGLNNTSVIYNCPKTRRPEPSDYFREHFGISDDRAIFLYQGVIGPGRGVHAMVDGFTGIDDAALVVMGYGPQADWMKEQAESRDNIYFHDAVPPADLMNYTAAADFGLSVIEGTSLSYEYCMPNKLFEYTMANKPVLVSPTIEQKRFVEANGIGIVAKQVDAEGVRAGVRELLQMDRAKLAQAVGIARETYCWEKQEDILRQIYTVHLSLTPAPTVSV